MHKIRIIFTLSAIFGLLSCSPQKKLATNYNYKTECLGLNSDGTQIVKAWGKGINKNEAIENAKITALNDVLFKGILDGKQDCNSKPILNGVNMLEKNETYFQSFFSEKGAYNQFIKLFNKVSSVDTKGEKGHITQGVELEIMISELKQKMINDGILKN